MKNKSSGDYPSRSGDPVSEMQWDSGGIFRITMRYGCCSAQFYVTGFVSHFPN
ncbi:MAG TPA: hypothetical protein VF369_07150 [candidate division Zixibacteria bacterium]